MQRINGKAKSRTQKIVVLLIQYIFLITFSYLLLYPFVYIVMNAFKGRIDFYDPSVEWVPKNWTFNNIIVAWRAMGYSKALLSTFIYGIIPALLQFCTCAIFAYGMARFKFKGQKLLMGALFLNILVPMMILIIPTYVNFQHLDFLGILGGFNKLTGIDLRPALIDTPWVFWLPALFGVGFKGGLYIFIYMQFFKGLPKELEEAAWIDGAGPWKTFFRIIVPSSGSAALTVLIFSVIWNWSDYYLPHMYLSENYPLSVELKLLMVKILPDFAKGLDFSSNAAILGGCLIFLIPLIIFYLIVQKKFVSSISTTGLVG